MRASVLLALTTCAGFGHAATVTLGKTQLIGTDIPSLRQELFAGIPYAEPPINSLRLRPPVPKRDLNITSFNATTYGFACIQNSATLTAALVSEDCLTINVLRPAGIPADALLPVMAWIYGGGFIGGTSATYNGSAIVAKAALRGTPVIYVNFNYRTGPLGFPQGREAAAKGSLNLGLKDQIMALQWIQSHIAAFGGDPAKVTVFGESAGAISIAIHMLNPDFSDLVRAAILESGSWASTLTNYADVREDDWQSFVRAIPACATNATSGAFACLQKADLNSSALALATATAAAQPDELYPFVPNYDGVGGVYPAPGSIILATGHWAKQVPFITGCNLDEGTAFTSMRMAGDSVEAALLSNFTPSLIPLFGKQLLQYNTEQLLELYPNDPALGAPFGTGNNTFGLDASFKQYAALFTDIGFHSQRRLFQTVAAAEGAESFGYHFIDPAAAPAPIYGVTHGTEVPYVYGSCKTSSQACQVMVDYWVSFATSLSPNDGKGTPRPTWSPYSRTSPTVLQLNGTNTTNVPDTYRKTQIAFLNRNALVFHQRSST